MDPDNSVADQQREQHGRRPPMHPSEAVSEGEKVNTDDERREDDQDVDTPPPEPATALVIQPTLDDVQDLDPTSDDATTSLLAAQSALRNRAAISPTASPLVPSDSSQDEAASPLALASPIPNLAALTRARILRSPTPNALEFSPPAVARTMAMHKLTGGTETYDPSPSPHPPPLPGKLGRNNTVSGGEQRKEARQLMLSRLGGRNGGQRGRGTDRAVTTPKRKRRRSRRGSGAANASANTAGVSDSEFISTSPNTPIVPQTPLPGSFDGFPEPRLPTPLSRAVTPHSPSEEDLPPLPSTSARASPAPVRSLRQSPVEPEQQQPRRRSVVVEDEDDEQRLPLPLKRLPTPPQLPQLNNDYSKHSPNLFNDLFPDIARASSVRASPVRASPVRVASPPALTAHSISIRSSPFNVPLQEKQSQEEEEEEEVLYPGDSYPLRNTFDDDFDRQISWIASPVPEILSHLPRRTTIPPPRNSYESKGIVVESETSPEIVPSQVPPSPSSVTALSQSLSQPTSMVRTASDDSTSPQQYPTGLSMTSRTQDRSPLMPEFDWDDVNKRNWDSGSISTWDKIKGTFRSGSAAGRRSARDNTDSSVSRESGASLGSGKTGQVNQTPLGVMQSGSASASAASLSQIASPFPTPSSTDLLKYQNVAKLFPFPRQKKLEEQRNRTKGMLTPSASTPDISTTLQWSPEPRDRKLSHQASDTRLLDKYAQSTSPPNSAAADIGYFNVPSPISPSTSTGSKLPMTLPGVKQWLNSRKKSSAANTPTSELGKLSPNPSKKPSLSDLILRKENGLGREWEDGEIIPLSASESMFGKSAESRAMTPSPLTVRSAHHCSALPELFLSEHLLSSLCFSASGRCDSGTQASFVLERLEENLSRGSRSPIWASAIDDPPRKLLLSSPVLQVVNANTALPDQDTGSDNRKIASQDRKFVVKSVVLLSQLRFTAERTDIQPKLGNNSTAPRNPMIRTFVYQFSKDMDHAITSLLSKSSTSDDALTLEAAVVQDIDLDRAKLGDYLSRRTYQGGAEGGRQGAPHFPPLLECAVKDGVLQCQCPRLSAGCLCRPLLNEYLLGGIAQEPGPTGFRSIASREFVDAFRRLDARYLVSDGLLEEIFESARITSSGPPDIQIMIKRPLPTRLTYKVQSDPIILRIQQADPDLTIQLFGQDLVFDPPYLTFARSSERRSASQTMIMCRTGPNALKYSGLPLGHSLVVERSFMRNTFEMAFLNHCGLKRRYMFSVDDPLIRHQWVVSLNRQIDRALATPSSTPLWYIPGASKFHRAAETVAFKVLQQTLIGSGRPSGLSPWTSLFALQDLGSISSPASTATAASVSLPIGLRTEKDARISAHVRSKSRSQMYLRGAGRNELDLNNEGEFPTDDSYDPDLSLRIDEMQCQQNSSIPLVLAFLQVGSPDHGQN
ncbi:hypothetical protein R3P38DRAFT_2839421 [Favolaschia claudopus]|uniref:PH domain-containing protein n=1 Tax=Favolaschia claudopus TaxID=2862362 RepID=A0AAW0DYL1_9AGAR